MIHYALIYYRRTKIYKYIDFAVNFCTVIPYVLPMGLKVENEKILYFVNPEKTYQSQSHENKNPGLNLTSKYLMYMKITFTLLPAVADQLASVIFEGL